VRPDEGLAEFDIDPAPIWPVDDDRLEPIFLAGPLWFEFEEDEPPPEPTLPAPAPIFLVEFEEFSPLDHERALPEQDGPSPASRRPASATGLVGSLGGHLLVLLALLHFNANGAPADALAAVPVQLVIEAAPAAPDDAPDRQFASTASETEATADSRGPAAAAPAPAAPARKQVAAAAPRPAKPKPPPAPSQAPKPPQIPAAAVPPAPAPAPVSPVAPPVAPPAPPTLTAATAGQASTGVQAARPSPDRSSYFGHLVVLTRPYFYMLPGSFLAGRRGRTVLSMVVREDGTVERIAVKRSSGYPDIDVRIQQMVEAVGRFPPLPEGFQRPSVELDFDLAFPDAMQQ
jgi:TonB family protein